MDEGLVAAETLRRRIAAMISPLPPQPVPLTEAAGLVLASIVRSLTNLPPFANSAMDGFALRCSDTRSPPARLRVAGRSVAGAPWQHPLQPGEAVAIATGAALPGGADGIVPIEESQEADGHVVVHAAVQPGRHVRREGEDIPAGAEVLPAGLVLGAGQIAAAAALGLTHLTVHRRPRVAILPTGDEVRTAGATLRPGDIHDALSAALVVLVGEAGGIACTCPPAQDDRQLLTDSLRQAAAGADLVVTTGGASVGDRDFIAQLGDAVAVSRVRVALRPARPFAFGTAFGTPLIALPGNPGSALASFEEFGRPAILALLGKPAQPRPAVRATLRGSLPAVGAGGGDLRLVRVSVWRENGRLVARSAGGQGAGMLHSLARANAWAVIPPACGELREDDEINVRLIGEVWAGDPFPPAHP